MRKPARRKHAVREKEKLRDGRSETDVGNGHECQKATVPFDVWSDGHYLLVDARTPSLCYVVELLARSMDGSLRKALDDTRRECTVQRIGRNGG